MSSLLFITYLHYSTLPGIHDLHNIFTEMYYIPLFLGALVFGLKGAILTFIAVSVLYLPHVVFNWTNTVPYVANQILHAVFSGTFSFLAGFLVDREKRYREQLEKDRYLTGLGQAASAIVHDLRNPLITVTAFARRILERRGDIDNAAQAVMDAARDMQLIVHDVLDFARPIRMSLTEADINSLIRKTCESCSVRAGDKGVTLSVHLPDKPVAVDIDRSHLERALVNLINNAIDASDRGQSVAVLEEPGTNGITIRIRDHGEGMDRETIKNIFIPFYTRKSSGTGLGMAIAWKIVEAHHGGIHVLSSPGAGTEVTIDLPYRQNSGK